MISDDGEDDGEDVAKIMMGTANMSLCHWRYGVSGEQEGKLEVYF